MGCLEILVHLCRGIAKLWYHQIGGHDMHNIKHWQFLHDPHPIICNMTSKSEYTHEINSWVRSVFPVSFIQLQMNIFLQNLLGHSTEDVPQPYINSLNKKNVLINSKLRKSKSVLMYGHICFISYYPRHETQSSIPYIVIVGLLSIVDIELRNLAGTTFNLMVFLNQTKCIRNSS